MKKLSVLFLFFLLMLGACAPFYKAENFQQIAGSHKTIAVLPPKVVMEIRAAGQAEAVRAQEKLESERFQSALAAYINQTAGRGEFFVHAQSPEETNRILTEKDIPSLAGKSYKDLADILGVDAVVSCRVSLAKPMSNAEAVLTSILTRGVGVASKVTTVDLSLTDRNTGRMFWNYNWSTGSTFVSSERMLNAMMKDAARNFPYKTKDYHQE